LQLPDIILILFSQIRRRAVMVLIFSFRRES